MVGIIETIRQYFGHFDIRHITIGDIEDFKRHRLNTPIKFKTFSRPRSIRAVNYDLETLRQVFNFAYRRRWIERSPFEDTKNLIDKSAERRRNMLWTRDDEEKALSLCKGKRLTHLRVAIICFVDGGFRAKELLGAKWSDVDFDAKIFLAKSYKGKSLSIRPVYMTDRMLEVLKEWKKEQKTIAKITDKNLVIGYNRIKRSWATIRSQIGRDDLRIHDLRHVFGSRLAFESDLPVALVSRALGHSNIKTTEIYLNTQNSDLEKIPEALNRYAASRQK